MVCPNKQESKLESRNEQESDPRLLPFLVGFPPENARFPAENARSMSCGHRMPHTQFERTLEAILSVMLGKRSDKDEGIKFRRIL